MTQTRQPKGVPVGGQFAANTHDEAGASLDASPYAPGGTADALTPRGFVSDDAIWKVERGLSEVRTGDESQGYADAMRALDVDDPDDPYFLEVCAAYDDAMMHDDFPTLEFAEDVRSLTFAYRGWNEDTYEEPTFGARSSEALRKPVAEVNRMLRQEFKDAQASGYLPETLDIRVFKHHSDPRVEVSGIPDEFRHRAFYEGETPQNTPERMRETPQFKELDRRLKAVAHTFAIDKTDHDSHDPVYLTSNMPIVTYQR